MSEQQPPRAGLSLYANLLGSTDNASNSTISRAPVVFSRHASSDGANEDSTAKKQANAAALRFQPTKRPQLPAQKAKPKPSFASIPAAHTDQASTAPIVKSTLADWAGDDDDVNGFFADQKRQRGGRKKRKKNNKEDRAVVQDWDDIYDPSRPNTYEDYKNSEEKYREVREWKDRLYAHRFAKERRSSVSSSGSDRYRPSGNKNYAPPAAYSFAPPPDLSGGGQEDGTRSTGEETGADAYARRMRIAEEAALHSVPPPPPPPPPIVSAPTPPQLPANTISRAPVRYNLPSAPTDLPTSEAELSQALAADPEDQNQQEPDTDAPRSLRPGQKGFAQRLMSKYGWTKGSGLGADNSGITAPLRVQVEKRVKRSDADGGGFVGPAGKGKIIGGKRKEVEGAKEEGKMSEVVVLFGMVDGMDLDAEVGDGGLMQEIGEECSEKYGNVERVYIAREMAGSVPVFVKFTSPLSALRAVTALEGRVFNGNSIKARFFDAEKFERGDYN